MNHETKPEPIRILLVEDNPSDACLTEEAFKECKVVNHIDTVTTGEEAMAFLRRTGAHSDGVRPDLVLLDLNLPGKDGREVLKEIKSDPDLKRIPVVILTTSKAETDILKSYDSHANAYVTKPVDLDQFTEAVKRIEDFWLAIVKFPTQ